MATALSEDELRRVYHHVFLPPQLPQQSDDETDVAVHLIRLTLDALRAHRKAIPTESSSALRNAIVAMENLASINSLEHGATSESELFRALGGLTNGQSSPVFIRRQNAAALATKSEEGLVFETFELSPSNAAVLSGRGRLIRSFPGTTVTVDTQQHPGLLKVIAETLTTMSHSAMPGMQPETIKAGAKHEEHRDTTHPGAVTQLFVSFLRGFGHATPVEGISKNTRDDVLWTDSLAPWRRSPVWLLIKVTLHLLLSRASGGSEYLYKRVMVSILRYIIDLARDCGFPSECLYAMSAKLVRRMHKLNMDQSSDNLHSDELAARVDDTLKRTSVMISGRWRKVQKKDAKPLKLEAMKDLKIEQDTKILLPALESYIKSMQSRSNVNVSKHFAPTTPLAEYDASALPSLPEDSLTTYHRRTSELQQFERWIEQRLDHWLLANAKNVPNACLKLHELTMRYHALASTHYVGNPEGISVMILTIFELWVACDKVAVQKCRMLSEYAPEIPLDVLQCLVLPHARQLERLLEVETYLQERKSGSDEDLAGLLLNTNNRNSFAARYFCTSKSHQELLGSIESEAKEVRKAKVAEFREMQATYERLHAWYEQEDCLYQTFIVDDWCDPPETESRHMRSICKKCEHQEERDSLVIELHEWPLPEDTIEASVVAFELKVPSWYSSWRDCRSYLLCDVLRGASDGSRPRAEYMLRDDQHLSAYYVGDQRGARRIGLLSEVKPQVNSHYKMKGAATMDVSQVCVKNGTRYRYHDKKSNRFSGSVVFNDDTVARSCTYTLPIPELQGYISRTAIIPDGKSPNSSIASQSSCPSSMSLEEYKELTTVPLGHHIQWPNILLQLTMPGVDFRKQVTTLVFWQCIYQTGPPSGDLLRESHVLFEDDSKALDFIKHLDTAVERIKRNWESAQALCLFASIAARVMALNAEVKAPCFLLLEKIRNIAMTWLHSLRELACDSTEYDERTLFISKSVEVALICASTFDVEDKFLFEMLSSTANASMLIQMAIVVQQGDSAQDWKDRYLSLLRLRFTRLLHRCYKSLAGYPEALNDAIKRSWAAYTPCATGWTSASAQADYWMMTETKGRTGNTMLVRYDLLSGELLVNGMPVDQPPPEYHTQPLYKTLFGTATVEVMPATSKGFRFSAKRTFRQHEVQFGLLKQGDLIVQASHLEEVIENVPSDVFIDDLPKHFVEEYVHWYNTASGNVEFRPADDPWNVSSPASWTLQRAPGATWKLVKDGSAIIGLQSPTAKAVAEILKPLANANRIHGVLQPSGRSIHVDIPMLRLNFSLTKGDTKLQSKEYRSMAVDENQELGTLVGFKNKLMLKSKNGERLLLLAEGKVTFSKQGAHVNVNMSSTDVITTVHALRIDRLLHRLVDNGDLGCKFYTAYLHALTSFCLPDPFTLTTGTEQALNILGSSAVRSFERLSQANVSMLTWIAGLCPGRAYYPTDKKVMQSVKWNGKLNFLAQHSRLRTSVQAIFDQAQQAEFYHPENKLRFPALQPVDQHLQQRDSIRTSNFRVPGYGAEEFTMHYDSDYDARDREINSRGKNAALMSGLMARNDSALHWPPLFLGRFWAKMYELQMVHGRDTAVELRKYRYDGILVKSDEFDYVLKNFPVHHAKLAACQLPEEKYSIAVWLATLAFAEKADMEMLQIFAMLHKRPDLLQFRVPSATVFDLVKGKMCTYPLLKGIIEKHALPFDVCPEASLAREVNEQLKPYNDRRHAAWQKGRMEAVHKFVSALEVQWPRPVPTTPVLIGVAERINVASAMRAVQAKFQLWFDNSLLYAYFDKVLRTISDHHKRNVRLPDVLAPTAPQRLSPPGHFTMEDIFSTSAPSPTSYQMRPSLPQYTSANAPASSEVQQPRLTGLLQALDQTAGRSKYEKHYSSDLRSSLAALTARGQDHRIDKELYSQDLKTYRDQCDEYVRHLYQLVMAAIESLPSSQGERTLRHWPRISPILLLQQLAHGRTCELPKAWKKCIVDYGVALTALQRAERLLDMQQTFEMSKYKALALRNKHWEPDDPLLQVDIVNELRNTGHTNWNPHEHPEYLLMEIESGIMIREVQQQIASEMRDPSSGGNAVMQLNMGEGKSTVIIPMVAAALADGSQLVRVVVAKPQSKQMAEMLISKFGGLLDRRIYYMPFSRSLKLDKLAAETMLEVLRQCRRSGGILLVQPEHILSFRLMAPECYIAGKDHVGKTLMATQDYFDEHSRDIVDESDENFSVRFELIYTMGTQQSIEMSPERWFLMQQILDMVQELAPAVAKELPLSIEVHHGNTGAFPRVRLLRAAATVMLVQRVAADIRDKGLAGFQMSRQTEEMREAVFTYITTLDLSQDIIKYVENGEFWESHMTHILLLRGILAGGILAFALGQKRWRVDFGLASRSPPTKLAVPYRAKDSPSLRSEFSHPDVVITLTSLCYYYEGLNDEDMFTAIGHLMSSDQADNEYQAWIKSAPDVPLAFRQLAGVNLRDRLQCVAQVFPALRFSKAAIDYFLSHIVFPKEMKEYPHKLSASGWDIGKKKALVTTGFSGTNDARRLLPLFVKQLELEQQTHTNALVLEYLLQPDNGVELMPPVTACEQITDAERLLSTVLDLQPPVEVILDVGAQILELDNLAVAKSWLQQSNEQLDNGKEAVVFVNNSDELCVVDRKGRIDLLQTSPYVSRLDVCLVFLDESHTRGIDLKLPSRYRAAVTLGAHLTKDRLVQACMRMRKLGQGQTVVFCISQEIQSKIVELSKSIEPSDITVADVLLWSISETHAETRRSMPLWTVQGERFIRQEETWQRIVENGVTSLSKAHSEELLDEEAQTIDYRYRPRAIENHPSELAKSSNPDLRGIARRCREFDGLSFNASTLQEEQERELSPETEAEREVPKPRPAKPADHFFHRDLTLFARSGAIEERSSAYMPAFKSLKGTSAWAQLPLSQLSGRLKLMVTADFATTILPTGGSVSSDTFQRHVQWVLARSDKQTREIDLIMIISPFEANILCPKLCSPLVSLHLYKPRCNAGYAALDSLELFTVSDHHTPPVLPRALSVQLGLFAGQLYISSYEDYLEICKFLGLSTTLMTKGMEDQGWRVGTDGFIVRDAMGRTGGTSGFSKSPVNFFKILLSTIRRNGDGISKTDMGGLLDGKPFQKSHWKD